MLKMRKYLFYIYVAGALHLLGFIILMPDNSSKIQRMLQQIVQQKRRTIRPRRVPNLIVESYQNNNERPRRMTPFVSESFNPARGNLTNERGYNVTEDSTPQREQSNVYRRNNNTRRRVTRRQNEENPDILLQSIPEDRPSLNVPKLRTKNHKRFILNFDNQGVASLNTRAFPNIKYCIKIAKKSWEYLVTFAPTQAIAEGAMKNSAVLVAFTLNRKGQVQKIWIHDSTNSETLEKLSLRAINSVKKMEKLGPQPSNYDIKVVYVYFYIGRYNDENYNPQQSRSLIKMKGAFYFEYKILKKNNRR